MKKFYNIKHSSHVEHACFFYSLPKPQGLSSEWALG